MVDQQPIKLTPEQQREMMEDFTKRTKEMDEKVRYHAEKLQLELSAVPGITPDGRVIAQPVWLDAKNKVEQPKNEIKEG